MDPGVHFPEKAVKLNHSRNSIFVKYPVNMMTSSNGNIFRATGPVTGEFPAQRPVTCSFDISFDLCLN